MFHPSAIRILSNPVESLEQRLFLSSQTFSNSGSITINDSFSPPTEASPYPSSINVSGVVGSVTSISVQLKNFGHGSPADVDVLLVNPSGDSIILMSDAGSNFSVSNKTLTFDDSGGRLPDLSQINTGTYRPTNIDDGSNDDFPDAPFGAPTGTRLSDLSGADPNGTWSLYITDDQLFNSGTVSSGWSITIASQIVAPTPSTPDLSDTSDTGVSSSDDVTASTSPTFTGTAEANSTVTIYADGNQIGQATATGAGAYSVATSGISEGVRNITATATDANGTSSPSNPLVLTIDITAPTINSHEFGYLTAHSIVYDFSENVELTFASTDISLQNLSQNTTISPGSMNRDYDAGANRATITFPGLSGSLLPDGNYRATINNVSVTDLAGNVLGASDVLNFFVLTADANHDRHVDSSDFDALAANFNNGSMNFEQGDFNYDGKVNALDANALATKYGTYLAPPPAAPLATTPDDRLSSPPPVSALFSRTRIEADADSIEAILS